MYTQGKFSTGKIGLNKKIPNVALGLMSAALLGPVFFPPREECLFLGEAQLPKKRLEIKPFPREEVPGGCSQAYIWDR